MEKLHNHQQAFKIMLWKMAQQATSFQNYTLEKWHNNQQTFKIILWKMAQQSTIFQNFKKTGTAAFKIILLKTGTAIKLDGNIYFLVTRNFFEMLRKMVTNYFY